MYSYLKLLFLFFFQAEDGIRDGHVTGVQTCALPISLTCPSRTASPCPIRSPGSRSAPRTACREQGDRPHDADCHILEREPEGRLQTPCVIVSILEDPDRVVERHEPLTNQVVVDSAAEDRGPEQDPLVAESIGKMSKSRALLRPRAREAVDQEVRRDRVHRTDGLR